VLLTLQDRSVIERLFTDFGYLGDEPNVRINEQNFLCENCAASFVAGCFLSAGNVTDPDKGYHLEFSSYRIRLLDDLMALLRRFDFDPRQTVRASARVLYFKNSSQIEDILTWMGAVRASLALMNTKIFKEINNTVNRRVNCESANIDKAIISASRDREAIETIYRLRGREYLPEELREIAVLRLRHPELTLTELGELLDLPLGKSGVSHRLRRIRSEAQALSEMGGEADGSAQ